MVLQAMGDVADGEAPLHHLISEGYFPCYGRALSTHLHSAGALCSSARGPRAFVFGMFRIKVMDTSLDESLGKLPLEDAQHSFELSERSMGLCLAEADFQNMPTQSLLHVGC